MKRTLAFALLAISLTAHAATWQFLYLDTDNETVTLYYGDSASIQRHGQTVRYWIKSLIRGGQKTIAGKSYVKSLSLEEVDCGNRTVKNVENYYYDFPGNEIYHDIDGINMIGVVSNIPPDSTSEKELKFACQVK